MDFDPQQHVLGVLVGAGEYPHLLIQGAKRRGIRVVAAGFRGAVGREIPPMCDVFRKFRVGSVEGPLAFFIREGVTHVILAGQIKPACIYTMWPDATARRLLAQLDRRNAHTIFGIVCNFVTGHGFTVLPSTSFMEENMPHEGHLAGPPPSERQMEEARHGMSLAREIARLDIGQSLVVHGKDVLCVEAFKGTNECLASGGNRRYPVTLCKVAKPGHDMRFDVPCLGVGTIRRCIRHRVNHICFEADRTILLQREEVIRLCHQHGITLHAMATPADGVKVPELAPSGSDGEHACALARALEELGIGHSAVVCEGVVIAVEDPEGPLKCIRRAGAYMKRIRFIRLANWLCRVLLGRKSSPPAPMVMGGTARFALSPEEKRAASRAGIHLVGQIPPVSPTGRFWQRLMVLVVCLMGLYVLCSCAVRPLVYPGSVMEIPDKPFGHAEEHLTIEAEDGTKLRGWFFNRGQGSPLVVLYCGNGQNVGEMIKYAEKDPARSYLLMNYRGYGDSEGSPSEKSLVQDARTCLAWARRQLGGHPASLSIVGFSLGSGVAVQTAAAESPDALVLICPFDSVLRVSTGIVPVLPHLLPMDTWKSIDYASKIHCPVTVIRASADGVVPPERTDALIAAFPQDPEVIMFPAGHNSIFAAPGFEKALYRALR